MQALPRERWTGQRIAQQTGLSRATVSRILRRAKLSRMRDLEPKPPVQRYEHAAAGDLLHLDIKQLGRIVRPSHRVTGNRRDSVDGAGWEYVHVAIDDHSRIAFSAIYPDEKQASVLDFLRAALAYYARFGIRFKAVLTDNGPAYRSHAMATVCKAMGLKHRFTRPYTPGTNGKAGRFLQTALREWACARSYLTSRGGDGGHHGPQLVEITPDKKVVWVLQDWLHFGPATAVQILDEPVFLNGLEISNIDRCFSATRNMRT